MAVVLEEHMYQKWKHELEYEQPYGVLVFQNKTMARKFYFRIQKEYPKAMFVVAGSESFVSINKRGSNHMRNMLDEKMLLAERKKLEIEKELFAIEKAMNDFEPQYIRHHINKPDKFETEPHHPIFTKEKTQTIIDIPQSPKEPVKVQTRNYDEEVPIIWQPI